MGNHGGRNVFVGREEVFALSYFSSSKGAPMGWRTHGDPSWVVKSMEGTATMQLQYSGTGGGPHVRRKINPHLIAEVAKRSRVTHSCTV